MFRGTRILNVRGAALCAVAAALVVPLSACGDDDEETTAAEGATTSTEADTASTEDVTVTATEYEFALSATPTADTKTVTFTNEGKEFHLMIFAKINDGFTIDEAVKLEGKEGSAVEVAQAPGEPGQTTTVDVKGPLEPGNYAMLCPIGGPQGPHYKLGQLEEFSIE